MISLRSYRVLIGLIVMVMFGVITGVASAQVNRENREHLCGSQR